MSGSVVATDGPVWGICMARNEADIIASTVAHMLTQVDHVLVADNLSTDDTARILSESGVEVIDDPDPAYRQSEKMTALAQRARDAGATWVVPFDADEIWYSPFGRIGDVLTAMTDHAVATADLFDHVPTSIDPADDTNPVTRIGWRRRNPGALPKVACRTRPDLVIEQGNHDATYGRRWRGRRITGQLVVRHYPYRTAAQFVAKARQGAAALRLTDLPPSSGAHWRQYAQIAETHGGDALADVFYGWFHADNPHTDPTLIYDPAPV